MSPTEEKILKMEADLQTKLDRWWKYPSGSLRHDYTKRSIHEIYAKADLWNDILEEIKSFEFISQGRKEAK